MLNRQARLLRVRPSLRRESTGWEAHLGADDIDEIREDEEPRRLLAFVFCPECVEREFRPSTAPRTG
jgi:hypothetical protein